MTRARSFRLAGATALVALAAVALVVAIRSRGDGGDAAPAVTSATVVVGAEANDLAVGLELTPGAGSLVTARATVLAPTGPVGSAGASLEVAPGRSIAMTACGRGCYLTTFHGRPSALALSIRRRGMPPAVGHFRATASWPAPAADAVVRRATAAFRTLRSLVVLSRLASSPSTGSTSLWRLQAPDRLSYTELGGGPQGVIVGRRRWDRDTAGGRWVESAQEPVHQPAPPWPGAFRSAHLLGSRLVHGRRILTVSFLDPATPSWFTIGVDQASSRTLWLDMVATAHFMHERYRSFNAPFVVAPPSTRKG
jgi:hypothetical protein